MSDAASGTPHLPTSALVYPDVYLPEDLARAVAERAEATHVSPGALLASLIERFVREHAGASREAAVANAGSGALADAQDAQGAWDAPGMVRRIVPLPQELAQAMAGLAAAWQRPVNDLICEAVQATLGESGGE